MRVLISFSFILTMVPCSILLSRNQLLAVVIGMLNLHPLLNGLGFSVKLGALTKPSLINVLTTLGEGIDASGVVSQLVTVNMSLVTGSTNYNGTKATYGIISADVFNGIVSSGAVAIFNAIKLVINLINFQSVLAFPNIIGLQLISLALSTATCKIAPTVKSIPSGTSGFSTYAFVADDCLLPFPFPFFSLNIFTYLFPFLVLLTLCGHFELGGFVYADIFDILFATLTFICTLLLPLLVGTLLGKAVLVQLGCNSTHLALAACQLMAFMQRNMGCLPINVNYGSLGYFWDRNPNGFLLGGFSAIKSAALRAFNYLYNFAWKDSCDSMYYVLYINDFNWIIWYACVDWLLTF